MKQRSSHLYGAEEVAILGHREKNVIHYVAGFVAVT